MALTILIPVWNEEEAIHDVVKEILSLPEATDFSVLLINDGSTDGTARVIDALAAGDKRVRVLHRPHEGKDHAVWAGIAAVESEWIGMTDGDGQYDPRDFKRLLDAAQAGKADAVWGVRARREDTSFRLAISKAGRRIKTWMLGSSAVSDSGCGIWVARKRYLLPIVQAEAHPAGQVHCHLADLMMSQGATIREQPIEHRARTKGTAKYGMWNRLGPGYRSLVQAASIRRALARKGAA